MAVKLSAVAKAEGFALWVNSIIGEKPIIIYHADHIEVDFTEEQQRKFKEYFNRQVGRLMVPRPTDQAPPDVQIRFGKILVPWSLQYLAPLIGGSFFLGYILRTLTSK